MLVIRYVFSFRWISGRGKEYQTSNYEKCTSMKLGCDGNNPCKTCSSKGIECKFSRLMSKPGSVRSDRNRKSPYRE